MSRLIRELMPDVQIAANSAIADMTAKSISFYVTSTLRTLLEQQALYAQGRKSLIEVNAIRKAAQMPPLPEYENEYTVTNCDGVTNRSNHQSGRALDVVPLVNGVPAWPDRGHGYWQPIADVMKAHGFEWGGDWAEFQDLPHYQLKETV